MFTGLFTGTRAAKRAQRLAEDAQERLFKAEHTILILEDRLATLEGQHKTLRGRFYAAGRPAESGPEGRTREERKAEAFAKAGWKPGQPLKESH